ncbi:MAG: PLP-dependent aminotransferase family protein [Cypionkella sp.]|nr:PLP-dependent aminotransferase family protein [Cypionkella sp.]
MDTIWVPILPEGEGPKYLALTRTLRDAIRRGDLPEGAQLPTVRELAWQLSVTPGTVSRAYQIATQEGLLEATVGRGTFVASRRPRLGPTQPLFVERETVAGDERVDMRSPQLPEVGQAEAISAALGRIADQVGMDWLGYTTQRSEAPLRQAVCEWICDRALGEISAQDLMLTHGGQSGIRLILDCCLRGDRPVVLTEDLAYPGFRYAARLARAEVVGIEMDTEGMRPDALEAACRKYGPQVLCLTPESQNPTTARMSLERRQAIVDIARRHDLQVIEDECYFSAAAKLPSLRAMAPERVWYVGSLSKSLSAALRFGYVVCPAGMGDTGRLAAQHGFFALSRAVSSLCLDLLTTGAAQDIHAAIQAEFSERLRMIVEQLQAFQPHWQEGLPFVWLPLPQGWRPSTFARMAEEEGVLLRSADEYALIHGRAPSAVRLALPGNIARQKMAAGVTALAYLLPRPPSDMAV